MKLASYRLWRERRRKLRAVQADLSRPECLGNVERDLEWIALYDQWKSARAVFAKVAVTLFVLAGGAALMLSILRQPVVNFVAEVKASSLEVQLVQAWRISQSVDTRDFSLQGMESIWMPGAIPTGVGSATAPAASASLRGGAATLMDLEILPPARVTIDSRANRFVLAVAEGAINGEINVYQGMASFSNSSSTSSVLVSTSQPTSPPETLLFTGGPAQQRPATLELHSATLSQEEIDVTGATFVEDSMHSRERFLSTVKGGVIRVLGVEVVTTLQERDRVTFDIEQCHRAQLEISQTDGILLRLEGSARAIKVGREGYMESLVPTRLEYLYSTQPLWTRVLSTLFVMLTVMLAIRSLISRGGI